jgi:glycosyltransferase involved in cell wall biosynthesis
LVVLEAMSRGTPTVLTPDDDNASVEFIEGGVNGFVAPSAEPVELAAAITQVCEAGTQLRESTLAAFKRSATHWALSGSLEEVEVAYAAESSTVST